MSPPRESPIIAQIQHHARATPEQPALVDRGGITTFGRLWEEATRCAAFLSARDLGDGTPVGLLLSNRATGVAALLGAARVGSVAILMPPTLAAQDLHDYCRAAGVRAVLAGPASQAQVRAAGARSLDRVHPELDIGLFEDPSFTPPPAAWVRPGDFLGQLTSGADLPPKIAIRTHAAVWSEIQDFTEAIHLTANDRVLVLSAISHSYGLIGGTLAPLCRGARAILGEHPTAEEALRLARGEGPTIMFGIPPVYRDLTDGSRGAGEDLSSLRLCFCAGAPLSGDVDDRFAVRYGRRISQDYGCTEAGVISLLLEWEPHLATSVGRPIRGRTVTIVDAQDQPVGAGRPGEIVVRTAAQARLYLGGLQSSGTMVRDPFATGDLGWMDDKGFLFLTGRKSRLVRMDGDILDPAEVEDVISRLPGVREVAVVGVPRRGGRESLKAVVVADGLSETDIIQHCRRYLPVTKVPEIVEFRASLPRTPAGKILRRALRGESRPQ